MGAFNPISCEGAIIPDVDWAPTSKRGRRTQYTADQITAMSDLIPSYDSLSEVDRTRKVTDLLAPTGLFANLGPNKRIKLLRALGRRVKTSHHASASKTAPAEGITGREEEEEEKEAGEGEEEGQEEEEEEDEADGMVEQKGRWMCHKDELVYLRCWTNPAPPTFWLAR